MDCTILEYAFNVLSLSPPLPFFLSPSLFPFSSSSSFCLFIYFLGSSFSSLSQLHGRFTVWSFRSKRYNTITINYFLLLLFLNVISSHPKLCYVLLFFSVLFVFLCFTFCYVSLRADAEENVFKALGVPNEKK